MDWDGIIHQITFIWAFFQAIGLNYKNKRKKSIIRPIRNIHLSRMSYAFAYSTILLPLGFFIFRIYKGIPPDILKIILVLYIVYVSAGLIILTLYLLFFTALDFAASIYCLIYAVFITTYLMLRDVLKI